MAKSNRYIRLAGVWVITSAACQPMSRVTEGGPPAFDRIDPYDDGEYVYTISTNSEEAVDFEIRLSNAADDIHCKDASVFSRGTVSAAESGEYPFHFSQMGAPHIALYEWHLCIEVDGVTYKGWRGFDPGPGSTLHVDCELDVRRLIGRETDLYLCHLRKVGVDEDNYGEYAAVCDPTTEHCRRFESADTMRLWSLHNKESDLIGKVTLAYFAYMKSKASWSSADPVPIYLSVAGADPSIQLFEQLGRLGIAVRAGSEWELGKGTRYAIGDIEPLSETSLSVVVSTYCGPLCASGMTVTLELQNGRWTVVSTDIEWVSQSIRDHRYEQGAAPLVAMSQ